MAVIDNKAYAIGDIILIETNTPLMGVTSLNSYTDTTNNETADRYFEKYFAYSKNNLYYSDWIELTDLNLQAVVTDPNEPIILKYKYVRAGTDSTSYIEFVDITINCSYGDVECGFYYNKSLFKDFFECDNEEAYTWCLSVLEKLWEEGVIPKYIERKISEIDDEDYIIFWKAISCYFAYFVVFSRQIETFITKEILLESFLQQRNLIIVSNMDLLDLQYLMEKYYDEIRQRGTFRIIERKLSVPDKLVDGELLRLYGVLPTSEFLFNLMNIEDYGWNLLNSSPLYRGLSDQINVNKTWEDSQDIVDLDLYPLINSGSVSIVIDGDKDVMSIGAGAGIGGTEYEKAIVVDPYLSYEITFYVKQPTLSNNFSFGAKVYDINDNEKTLQLITGATVEEFFFENQILNRNDKYYFVRGIIYSLDADTMTPEEAILNIGFGVNLKFADVNIVKLIPEVLVGSNTLRIWDFKMKPVSTPFSLGFIQTANLIISWIRDNNNFYTKDKKEEIARRFLLPYDCKFKNIYIGE